MLKLSEIPIFVKQVLHETTLRPSDFAPLNHTPSDTGTSLAWVRIALTWVAYFLGSITLQDVGIVLAGIFTSLQIIVLLRDKFGLFARKEKA